MVESGEGIVKVPLEKVFSLLSFLKGKNVGL
jgi:hypothetical protein